MSASTIRAGEAYVEITIRDKLTAGLERAQGKLRAFGQVARLAAERVTFLGKTMAAIGAAGVAGMGKAVKTFLDVSKAAKDAGKAIGGVTGQRADKLSKAFEDASTAAGLFGFAVGSAVADPLSNLLGTFSGGAIQAAKFVSANESLVISVAKVFTGLVVAGSAVAAFGVSLKLASIAASGFQTAIAGVGIAVTFLSTPFGLLTAAIVAVSAAIVSLGWVFRQELVSMARTAVTALDPIAEKLGGSAVGLSAGIKAALSAIEASPQIKFALPNLGAFPGLPGSQSQFGLTGSRGQFGGFRAESLAVGNGGGIAAKMDKEIGLLERIRDAVERNVTATKDIESPTFK